MVTRVYTTYVNTTNTNKHTLIQKNLKKKWSYTIQSWSKWLLNSSPSYHELQRSHSLWYNSIDMIWQHCNSQDYAFYMRNIVEWPIVDLLGLWVTYFLLLYGFLWSKIYLTPCTVVFWVNSFHDGGSFDALDGGGGGEDPLDDPYSGFW